MTAGPGADDGLSVPFLVDPDHEDLAEHIEHRRFFWLDLQGPTDEQLHRIASKFGLHPLTVEDARTFNQGPKIEEYGSYIFLVAYGVDPGTSSGGPLLRELHMILSGDFVVTIHRRPLTALDDLRARYDEHPVRGEQFLVYKILDAMTQTFFPVLTRIDDDIDEIEQQVIEEPREEILKRIFSIKRDLVAMRRVVSPERDVFARDMERIAELRGLAADGRLYFRDLYDSLSRVSELVDSYRDLLSGATDMYLSTIANRQGEVNKQLTMIATVFLPLTFLTGFFGQNFSFLTDHVLNTTLSFVVLGVGLLVASIVGFIVYFRRKRWM
ncbi:MAG: magnesium/cobalt transporter CorA [Solirubrobacteraceae bacterium]